VSETRRSWATLSGERSFGRISLALEKKRLASGSVKGNRARGKNRKKRGLLESERSFSSRWSGGKIMPKGGFKRGKEEVEKKNKVLR